jgi:hypothetical protein
MDINMAALELKKIEIIERQISFLNGQAAGNVSEFYAEECNVKSQELVKLLNIAVIKSPGLFDNLILK